MTDNEQTTNQAAPEEPSSQEEQASKEKLTDEIFSELTVLANRFVDVVQQAWNSEDRKRIEADLKKGLNNVATGLEEGFQKVTENEKAQKVLNRADEVAEDVGGKLAQQRSRQRSRPGTGARAAVHGHHSRRLERGDERARRPEERCRNRRRRSGYSHR
ncbi:MAG: hypothetical protein R2854_09720 [Caldilineaceae bacterium]